MLGESEYQTVTYYGEGRALNVLWDAWRDHKGQTFTTRTNTFFWILERLLHEGRIKLHKDGVFFDGSVEEQVEKFRASFPRDEDDADRVSTKPGYEAPYKHFGMNVWWFLDICPAGVAWRKPDGSYQIAD